MSSSRQDVHAALTADLAADRQSSAERAPNILDLDGLLHVDDVDRFIDALRVWQRDVVARNARGATLREVRDHFAAVGGSERIGART